MNIFIGTVEPGHATPAATWPFGMVQAGPDTSAKQEAFVPGKAHVSGYDYRDGWLWRFSQTHLSGAGCASLGDFGILPFIGGFKGDSRPAKLKKETEIAIPGFYAVTLEEDGKDVAVEITASAHSALYRIRYPRGSEAKLLLDLDWGLRNPNATDCFGRKVFWSRCEFPDGRSIRGGRKVKCWNDYEFHFAATVSRPIVAHRRVRVADGLRGDVYELNFGVPSDGLIELRIGLSTTSSDAAAKNLAAETDGMSFVDIRSRSEGAWRELLSRVVLDDATPQDTATSFRAALYRLMFQPNDLSDVGSRPKFSTFSLWDTFRAAHPLYTILAPEKVTGFVNSMLDQYDRQGYLPIWALGGNENHCMIGHHAVPVIVDAYLKGFQGVDWERAYSAITNSLTVNHRPAGDGTWGLLKEDWDILDRYGYYPFDRMRGGHHGDVVRGESVSRVLECSYDDACAARMARKLGRTSDADFFTKRAGNWRNVYDPETGFMRGKDSEGRWRTPFNPWEVGAGPWRANDFCEGNSWQYSWHVLHEPRELIALMGGDHRFVSRLESLFSARPLTEDDGYSYDVSGMIGQYAHGNEPSHHVIYFFTLANRNDLAAKYVREVFETQYKATPDGLSGNEDCGQMAAWYVFSALGFYPFDPCGGDYVIGAPQVPGATIRLPGGKSFSVVARGFSRQNRFVKSVTLNGRPLSDFILHHSDIMEGGRLEFQMEDKIGYE